MSIVSNCEPAGDVVKGAGAEPIGLPVRVEILQKADRLVFPLVCLFLTLLRKFSHEPDSSRVPDPESLIFVKLAEQGSTVLAAGAIRRAADRLGRSNVCFICFEENRFILDLMDLLPAKNIYTVPTTSLLAMVLGTMRAVRAVRRRKIDAAVDLEFFARFSAAITWLTGARWRAGLHAYFGEGPYRGDLMTHRVNFNARLHTADLFSLIAGSLERRAASLPTVGVAVEASVEPEFRFVPQAGEKTKVERLIREHTGPGPLPPLVLLNANASDLLPLRRWDPGNYRDLAAKLLERLPGVWVVFTGIKSEASKSLDIVGRVDHPRCFSVAGRTSLRELLVLYTLAKVLVTNDSGPAHFAALTPIDVVVLFGPETPALFAARSPRNHVVYANLSCSPCVNAYNNRQTACRDNRCMQAISVDRVLVPVERLLGQAGRS